MKNLKKVLALVLVIAMVMGFAVSASATEFSDADQVAEQNATAVEVLSALNIINGFPDGTYRPTESVTRAQVAKMIAVAFNNGDESLNELYQNVACGLTDIGGSWAEGYIKYCYATGIVNGYPDGTFRPEQEVTGNELCQIMLNILGYEIDTTNTPWATAVMAKSSTIGLLKNVSTAAGSACPRQEAAQIIYNALTLPILQANALGVLVPSSDTILSKYLGGASEVVVVTGNEYADLNGSTPLEEGKTEVNNDTTLNWSTTMDMIGSSYTVWTVGKTVIYAEDSGLNTIEEFTANANLAKAISMKTDADTEDYVNFDDKAEEYYTADMIITYKVNEINLDTKVDSADTKSPTVKQALISYGYDEDLLTGKTFSANKVVRAGETLSDNDLAVLEYIFTNYNTDNASVVVGTKQDGDISNVTSFSKFVANYLTSHGKTVDVTANENGNYVKVVDNDGDGVAEYILKTQYTMAVISEINSRNEYTLTSQAAAVKGSAIATEDELAEGDVVVYAPIDGVYYMNLAEMVTETIDKKGINVKAETITCGDNTYGQSYITKSMPSTYYGEIIKADTEVSYDLYLDNYGYVRAYIESSYRNGIVLLTDAYYNTNKRVDTFQATIYDREAEEQVDVDVVDGRTTPAGTFIDTSEFNNDGNRGTWERLEKAHEVYSLTGSYLTNLAGYTTSDAGYSLSKVTDLGNGATFSVKDLTITTTTAASDRTLYDANNRKVQATTSTVYYLVTTETKGSTTSIKSISSWTGYSNAPSTSLKGGQAYAVTTVGSTNYDVAQIVVFEVPASVTTSTYFIYDKLTTTYLGIGYDSDAAAYDDNMEVRATCTDLIEFYTVGATTEKITAYNANYIFGGPAYTLKNVYGRDYWGVDTVSNYASKNLTFRDTEVPVYAVSKTNTGKYVINDTTIDPADELILVTDSKYNVQYVINASKSTDAQGNIYTDVSDLYTAITTEAAAAKVKVTISGVKVAEVAKGSDVTLEKPANATGTGFKGSDGKYYAYDEKVTVNADLALEPGYVAFTKGTTTTPVAYNTEKTNDYIKDLAGTYAVFSRANVAAADAKYATGVVEIAGQFKDMYDTTFIDGLYKVTVTLTNATSAIIKSGTVYNAKGEQVTTLAQGDVVYAAEGTVIATLTNSKEDASYTIKADTEIDPATENSNAGAGE